MCSQSPICRIHWNFDSSHLQCALWCKGIVLVQGNGMDISLSGGKQSFQNWGWISSMPPTMSTSQQLLDQISPFKAPIMSLTHVCWDWGERSWAKWISSVTKWGQKMDHFRWFCDLPLLLEHSMLDLFNLGIDSMYIEGYCCEIVFNYIGYVVCC